MGRYVVTRDRRSGSVINRAIFIDKSLNANQSGRVVAHELGHAIDEISGSIPVANLNNELRLVYNDLNNPQRHGKLFGPEQNRYKGEKAQRELMAEAIRAYATDPNYLKMVAPNVAARIRKYVNDHPDLKHIIQFNALAGATVLGASASGTDAEAVEGRTRMP